MTSQMTPAGPHAREPGEVDRGLGLAGALEHAAGARAQREDVAGLDDVARAGGRRHATAIVCARSLAEMPVSMPSRASIETVKAVS